MEKIETLTEEHKALLSEYRDKWLAIGLDNRPANRELAEKGIEEAYKVAGLRKPKIVWTLSPLSSGLSRYFVSKIFKKTKSASVGESVRASVWESVRASVWESVRASVRASVWDSVGESVRASVWDSVWDSVGDSVGERVGESVRASVWDSVGASVGERVGDSVGESVRASVWDSGHGQHDANWLGFYDYFCNVLGLKEETKQLGGLWLIAKNAGWFLPHKNICWISERHDICKLKNGRIHADGSPAIHYPDGFSIWALNGIRVTKEIAETPAEKLNPELILNEQNVDIQREIIKKIGAERVLKKLNSTVLDTWTWSKFGYKYQLMELKVNNLNRKYLYYEHAKLKGYFYAMPVPPDVGTAQQGLCWIKKIVERAELNTINKEQLDKALDNTKWLC